MVLQWQDDATFRSHSREAWVLTLLPFYLISFCKKYARMRSYSILRLLSNQASPSPSFRVASKRYYDALQYIQFYKTHMSIYSKFIHKSSLPFSEGNDHIGFLVLTGSYRLKSNWLVKPTLRKPTEERFIQAEKREERKEERIRISYLIIKSLALERWPCKWSSAMTDYEKHFQCQRDEDAITSHPYGYRTLNWSLLHNMDTIRIPSFSFFQMACDKSGDWNNWI